MKLDFNFKESTESFNFDFTESNQKINTDFGEVHVVGSVVVDPTLTVEGAAADAKAVGDALQATYMKLNSNTSLGFYCIEDVTVVTNGVPKTYPANSNVDISFADGDVFEIIPTSDNSILSLTAFPGALGTFYPWLEGVAQFSNILFDMNDVEMYSKWSQGNQGSYHVQKAQYLNCIFWSDNPYISDVSKRTNYTLTHTSQLPLCYSNIPDNTFKAFYLAFGVNSDPNWGNQVYKDSFAKATWATQVFSYYGARTVGIFGHDDPDFNIVLPKDCRGLMCEATAIENAGTFDAVNVTNFGAKQGSWRDAFRMCYALRNLYIKNLKVNLNVSWSPLEYDSINYILSTAANTKKITISVSPYTYNLLSQSDFDLATSKNIVIELLTTNYVEDKRLSAIANKVDKTYVDEIAREIPNSATVNEQNELVMQHGENPLFSVPLPSGGGGGDGGDDFALLGTYNITVSTRMWRVDLSQFDIKRVFIKASFDKSPTKNEICIKLGSWSHPLVLDNSVYPINLFAHAIIIDGRAFGVMGYVDGWQYNQGNRTVVTGVTPRAPNEVNSTFEIYWVNASEDTTPVTIEIYGR